MAMRSLSLLLALVATLLTTSTAATVWVATDASRSSARGGERLITAGLEGQRRVPEVMALADSLVAPLGLLQPLDSVQLRQVVRVLHGRRDRTAWIDFDTHDPAVLDTVALLRSWARSAPLAPWWGYRPSFGGVQVAWELPIRSTVAVRRFVLANEKAADSALLAGDVATALTRAQETVAGARHLIGQPVAIDVAIGRYMLLRGARLLDRAARQADEPMVASAARRLDTMSLSVMLGRREYLAMQELAATPEDGRLLAIAEDPAMAPAARLYTFHALVAAACRHPREIIFGLASSRTRMLEELLAAVEDLPRSAELIPLHRRGVETFDDPAQHLDWARWGTGSPLPFEWAVPRAVRDRVRFCRTVR